MTLFQTVKAISHLRARFYGRARLAAAQNFAKAGNFFAIDEN
jgi:hypothetical protein